jgi:hypothetical protein
MRHEHLYLQDLLEACDMIQTLANDDVPVLRRQVMAILQEENPEQPQQGACA